MWLFGYYKYELIKTSSIHSYTLVKSISASSDPPRGEEGSLPKFDADNAIHESTDALRYQDIGYRP
ncbi:hypothetical protein EGD00_12940 [Pectobacterium carotovorum subsp. carotovorum]|nr:hypothetical protein EGD00_12940 [Pectobacterium carotovorum subsp. carotovorum]